MVKGSGSAIVSDGFYIVSPVIHLVPEKHQPTKTLGTTQLCIEM